jgi:hypothetical protein
MTTDTKAVARWDFVGAAVRSASSVKDGDYVLFADHERVVGELVDEVRTANGTEHTLRTTLGWLEDEFEKMTAALAASRAEVEGLRDGLSAVYQYGSDTLRGPTGETLDDRAWQRQAVLEMTNRASRTLDSGNWKGEANV